MACPYFYPVERFSDQAWPRAPRLPLGDPYLGLCCVDPLREHRPDEETLRELCNRGYPRNRCPRFPPSDGPDMVRFAVTRDSEGLLRISYVIEKNGSPMEHGEIEYEVAARRFRANLAGGMLERQAQAYAESYLRRKAEPQEDARHPHRR
ncbi:MAG: hypothetical protein RMI94_08865 [Bryobacterales bacterium]|nr:hypothetical protein [Bryobacteraceae bacterium]MDW8130648.1 hypothetical protein [Bryobacterales bacterium]